MGGLTILRVQQNCITKPKVLLIIEMLVLSHTENNIHKKHSKLYRDEYRGPIGMYMLYLYNKILVWKGLIHAYSNAVDPSKILVQDTALPCGSLSISRRFRNAEFLFYCDPRPCYRYLHIRKLVWHFSASVIDFTHTLTKYRLCCNKRNKCCFKYVYTVGIRPNKNNKIS